MRLQKPPLGFLDALQLKTDGEAPSDFSPVVHGSIDLMDHYLAQQQTLGIADANLTAIGDTVSIQVPQGNVWRVHCVSINAAIVTETLLVGALFYQPTVADVRVIIGQVAYAAAAATCQPSASIWMNRPLLAMPGSVIGFRLYSTMGAARAFALRTFHEAIGI